MYLLSEDVANLEWEECHGYFQFLRGDGDGEECVTLSPDPCSVLGSSSFGLGRRCDCEVRVRFCVMWNYCAYDINILELANQLSSLAL